MEANTTGSNFRTSVPRPCIEKVFRGRQFESLAARYCEQRGYQILERNLRIRSLEADIIARQGRVIVIVEVRGRVGARFLPSKTITPSKQRKLDILAGILSRRHHRPVRVELLEILAKQEVQRNADLSEDLEAYSFKRFVLRGPAT